MPTMPNVVGLNVTQATVDLIQAGIVPDNGLLPTNGYVQLGYFDNWPVSLTWAKAAQPGGTVTAQSPAANATVAFRAAVALTVSNYPLGVSSQFSAGGYN